MDMILSAHNESRKVKTAVRVVWHIVRHTVATLVSTATSAVLPVLIASTPFIVSVVWVLTWIAAILLYVLTRESIDVEMGDPFGIVLVPLLLSILGIVSVSAALLLAVAFNVLLVLPVSLITEFVCHRLSAGVVLRLISFVVAGLLLGVVTVSIVAIIVVEQQAQASPLALLAAAIALLLTCIGTVFTSGFTLTTMSFVKDKIVALLGALKERLDASRRSEQE